MIYFQIFTTFRYKSLKNSEIVANPHSQLEMLISRELFFCSLDGHPLFFQRKDFVQNLEGFFLGYRDFANDVLGLGIILCVHGAWGCFVQM